jgi:hypothetical protein
MKKKNKHLAPMPSVIILTPFQLKALKAMEEGQVISMGRGSGKTFLHNILTNTENQYESKSS